MQAETCCHTIATFFERCNTKEVFETHATHLHRFGQTGNVNALTAVGNTEQQTTSQMKSRKLA